MLTLRDELFDIAEYLDDANKLSFTATCILLCEMRCKLIYDSNVYVCGITHLPYFDQFKSVVAFMDADYSLPKNIEQLHIVERICDYFTDVDIDRFICSDTVTVPSTVTHLTIGSTWDQVISLNIDVCNSPAIYSLENLKFCIPNSVSHLEFGDFFNRTIQDIIPPSVT